MMKIFVQYFLILALIVGSAKSQCQLAGDCNECLNIAKPLGDRCTVSFSIICRLCYFGFVIPQVSISRQSDAFPNLASHILTKVNK